MIVRNIVKRSIRENPLEQFIVKSNDQIFATQYKVIALSKTSATVRASTFMGT